MKPTFSRLPIRFKLLLIVSGILTFISIFNYTYYPELYKEQVLKNIQDHIINTSELTGLAMGVSLELMDFTSVRSAIELIKKDKRVVYLGIFNKKGEEIAFFNPDKLTFSSQDYLNRQGIFEVDEVLFLTGLIQYENRSHGKVLLGLSLEDLNSSIHAYQKNTLYLSLGLLLLGLALSLLMGNLITRPLSKLTEGTRAIAQGDFQVQIKTRTQDEVGQLATAFNTMAEKLNQIKQERDQYEKEILIQSKFPEENPFPVLRISHEGTLLYANSASRLFLELLNSQVGGSIPETFRPGLEEARNSNHPVASEINFGDKTLRFVFCQVLTEPYVNVYAQDITPIKEFEKELKKAKEIAEQSNKSKSDFLAIMSHELRTPLNGILGFADLLESKHFGPLNKKQVDFVNQIDNSGKHLLTLITDLLDMAKIESGSIELEWETQPIQNVLDSAITMIKPQLEAKKIQLSTSINYNLAFLYCDIRRIRQVIINLLSNAIKYTPENGKVQIKVEHVAEEIRFSVIDNGIGIKEKDQEHIFEEFHQADRKRDESLGGLGIGLALTRQLIELHGGKIEVESEEGEGSTFWFTLPNQTNELESSETPTPSDASTLPATAGNRILVVEDNETNLAMILDMLSTQHHQTFTARNGQEALDIAPTCHPELILMDVRMPVMDGLEATRIFRSMPDFQNIPIVALTASAGEQGRDMCLDAGCNEHLSKPVRSRDLFSTLEKYLPSSNQDSIG